LCRDCVLHRGFGSAQATFRGGGGLLFNRANIFIATASSRAARTDFSTKELPLKLPGRDFVIMP